MEILMQMEPQAIPGRQDGELTVTEVAQLWGYRRSHTWHMIAVEGVVPYRQDRNRIYVRRRDAEDYLATLPTAGRRRGRAQTRGGTQSDGHAT